MRSPNFRRLSVRKTGTHRAACTRSERPTPNRATPGARSVTSGMRVSEPLLSDKTSYSGRLKQLFAKCRRGLDVEIPASVHYFSFLLFAGLLAAAGGRARGPKLPRSRSRDRPAIPAFHRGHRTVLSSRNHGL